MSISTVAQRNDLVSLNRSSLKKRLRPLVRDKWALVSVLFLLFVVFVALTANLYVPDNINSPNFGSRLLPPMTEGHIAGTDQLGRDVLGRLILGSRISLIVGFGTVFFALLIGIPIGMMAGYFGGWLDSAPGQFYTIPKFAVERSQLGRALCINLHRPDADGLFFA